MNFNLNKNKNRNALFFQGVRMLQREAIKLPPFVKLVTSFHLLIRRDNKCRSTILSASLRKMLFLLGVLF